MHTTTVHYTEVQRCEAAERASALIRNGAVTVRAHEGAAFEVCEHCGCSCDAFYCGSKRWSYEANAACPEGAQELADCLEVLGVVCQLDDAGRVLWVGVAESAWF